MMMHASKNMGPFPKEVLRVILMLVDRCSDLHHCELTCKSWRAVISDNGLLERLFDGERIVDFNDWETACDRAS
jgi:hypothetical protein